MKQIRVVAKAVIQNNEGDILLLRRSKNDKRRPGGWDFPGGCVEDNEDFTEAAAREIEEETGLILGHHELHLVYTQMDKTAESKIVCHLSFVSYTDIDKIVLSDEHDEFIWLPLDKALEIHDTPRQIEVLEFIRDERLLHN